MPTAPSAGTAQDHDEPRAPTTGRRGRKRQETRARLVRVAIDLFTARGFDEVTVADIAEEADVDQSTFFRHFGSKEAVLFTDITDQMGRVNELFLARPDDEPILTSLVQSSRALAAVASFDADQELLRARLTESSPAIRAQVLAHRELVVEQLAEAIETRRGIDGSTTAEPYLAATTWVAALDWYRRAVALGRRAPGSIDDAIDAVLAIVAPTWSYFGESPHPQRPTTPG